MRNDSRSKNAEQRNTKITLTPKETSELIIEAIVTVILELLLNLAVYFVFSLTITRNETLNDAIFQVKDILVYTFKDATFWSWGKFAIFFMLIADVIVLIWRLKRRYRQMQLTHILEELHYIANGHYNHRIPFELNGELGEVTQSINMLVDSTIEAIEDERRIEQSKDELITNVSHDIRTPLTSIIGYLGLIEENQYHTEEERSHYTHTAYLKAKQMKVLVDDLFEYTKVRQPSTPLNLIKFDLNQLLAQLAADFELEASKKGMEILVEVKPVPFMMEADTEKLVRVFNNLVSNALKYGKGGHTIVLGAEKVGSEAIVVVKNDGPVIPQKSLEQLFDRFYRVEESRSQETGGTGLGLAIAQSIVALHGGYIYAKSDSSWTTFTMHLPLQRSPQTSENE